MRVVLDTNVLVSASWKPGGLEARIVDLAITGLITPCISPEVLAEYRDVLSRPKLACVGAVAQQILAALERAATYVESTVRIAESVDDDDNRFLECAAAANADYLITGNLRHYPATWSAPHGIIHVVNGRAFFSVPPSGANPTGINLADTNIDALPLK